MRRPKVLVLTIVLSILSVLLTGCSHGSTDRSAEDFNYAKRALSLPQAATGFGPEYSSSLDDLLVNALYKLPDGRLGPLVDSVVSGTVIDVEKGQGFVADDDHPNGRAIDFDDPSAEWKIIMVTVEGQDVAGKSEDSRVVKFHLTMDGSDDFEKIRSGLTNQRVVAFLATDEGRARIFRVLGSGSVLAFVDEAGNLSLPLLGAEDRREEKRRLGQAVTLQDLERAAMGPDHTVEWTDPDHI